MSLTPADYRKTAYTHRIGLAADRPDAADVLTGTLYFSSDTTALERSNGTTWEVYTGSGSGGGIQYLGEWVAGTYNNGDIVVHDEIAYICVKDGVTTAPDPWPVVILGSITSVFTSSFAGLESPLSEGGHWVATSVWNDLVKNTGANSSNQSNASRKLSDTVTADQYSEITYAADPGASNWIGTTTRQSSGGSCYLVIAHDGAFKFYNAVVSGTISFTLLNSVSASIGTAPRTLRLSSVGSTHTIAFNGTDVLVHSDSTYTTGSVGIAASNFGGSDVKISHFDGGNIIVASGTIPDPVTTEWVPIWSLNG